MIRELVYKIVNATEFWSAIIGAIVGGLIALAAQMLALRAARKQRDEDHKRSQQALANSLLFKMMRIHSNFGGIHKYIEDSFEEATQRGLGDASWQFIRPLVNVPTPVHFSPDEMGMLLAQKDDDVFNDVLVTDDIHNNFLEIVKSYNHERTELRDRLTPEQFEGDMGSGVLSREQMLALQPRLVGVNSLAEQLRKYAADGSAKSMEVLDCLQRLLRERLGLQYKIEPAPRADPARGSA